MESKSIEELENNVWVEPSEFPTELVEKCYQFRKIKISELSIEQIRLLISQKIGVEYLLNIALNELEKNPLVEGFYYEGDLLVTVSELPHDFWVKNKTQFFRYKTIVEQNSELIKSELGENRFAEIKSGLNF